MKKKTLNIFKQHGEEYFRKIEEKTLHSLVGIDNHVISLGAGTLLSEKNLQVVSKLGLSVWLDVSLPVIAYRLNRDIENIKKRPLLTDIVGIKEKKLRYEKLIERLEHMLSMREKTYKNSHIVLQDSYSSVEDCARKLKSLIETEKNHFITRAGTAKEQPL